MKHILTTILMSFLITLSIYADNTVDGEDMPWDDDDPTAIEMPKTDTTTSGPSHPAVIYDLQGRRVDTPLKGQIYIVNGKKFIQK